MAAGRPNSQSSFRDIRVWQNAMQLAVDIFQLAGTLPASERPGLSTALQQTVIRIPTYIAAGHKSGSRSTMVTACHDAWDTCNELESLLIIVGQLYPNVPSNDLLDQLDEVQQMLRAVIARLVPAKNGPRKTV